MANNKFIRVLRNSVIYSSRSAAITALQGKLATTGDGEIVIASYGTGWDTASTVFGFSRNKDGKHSFTIFDPQDSSVTSGLGLEKNGNELKVKMATGHSQYLKVDANGVYVDEAVDAAVTKVDTLETKVNDLDALKIKKITTGIPSNVKERYQIVKGASGTAVTGSENIDIIKESSLKEVTIVSEKPAESGGGTVQGQFIKLVYELADGTEATPIYCDIQQLLSEAEFKNGLQVTDHKVSVKLSTDTESAKYLKLDGTEGEKALKVSGVDVHDYTATVYETPFEAKVTAATGGDAHIVNGDSPSEAFKKTEKTINLLVKEVIDNEETIAQSINSIADATGIVKDDGQIGYTTKPNAVVISQATSVNEAVEMLDTAFGNISVDPSAESGNALEKKSDGLYISEVWDAGEY